MTCLWPLAVRTAKDITERDDWGDKDQAIALPWLGKDEMKCAKKYQKESLMQPLRMNMHDSNIQFLLLPAAAPH